ncbi:PAS domain-containing sensor histidine kinase [Pedosphaera parvula]|uniref:histidine kinase n=1 Tax=Pedosphaera parvula (strain Ellin514) TaxID=320771 RepID=B9XQL9_PEDPL|nr:PAS domain S-box protein [Pedosphaera parvula]EEF57869.1 PAS/PAC sensor signal transduction histidine kinase [Pedosphaera parvula Ellin514]
MEKEQYNGRLVGEHDLPNESAFRSLLEHSPDVIARLDPEFRHLYVNPAIETLLGIPLSSSLGKTVAEMGLPHELLTLWETHLKDVFADHRQSHFDFQLESHSQTHSFHNRLIPEFSPSGTVDSVLEIISDHTRCKRLDTSLQEQEELFRLMVTHIQECAMILLDQDGRISSWNIGAERILNHKTSEVWKSNYSCFFSDEDIRWNKPAQELSFAREKGRTQTEVWLKRKDGSRFLAEMVITLLKSDQGEMKGFSLIIRDITEHKRFEEQVQYQRALLEALSETSPDGILISTEQKILYFNHRFREIWKFPNYIIDSRSNHVALEWAVSCIRDPEAFSQRVAQAYKDPDMRVHDEICLKDGRTLEHYGLPVHGNGGQYYGRVWFFRDITSSKAAMDALEESEERFRVLAESSPMAIFHMDAEGRAVYVNPVWENLTGLKPMESFGHGWTRAIYPPDLEEVMIGWKEALKKREKWCHEHRLLGRDGRIHWVRVLSSCILSPAHEVVGYVATVEDISERKETEAILLKAKENLECYTHELEERVEDRTVELKQTLHTMENCLYSVAHDFKAPLRAIDGFTTTLVEDYARLFDEKGRELANEVVRATKRMDALISDFLEYGELAYMDVHCSPLDVEPCISAATAWLKSQVSANNARITLSRPMGRVLGNQDLLTKVSIQIIANALKFVAPGVQPAIHIWTEFVNDHVRINFQDNGIGIEPEFHDKIFGIFNRLHGKEIPGTGIGLAIVKKAMERMNGIVGVASRSQQGTTLWIELPASK